LNRIKKVDGQMDQWEGTLTGLVDTVQVLAGVEIGASARQQSQQYEGGEQPMGGHVVTLGPTEGISGVPALAADASPADKVLHSMWGNLLAEKEAVLADLERQLAVLEARASGEVMAGQEDKAKPAEGTTAEEGNDNNRASSAVLREQSEMAAKSMRAQIKGLQHELEEIRAKMSPQERQPTPPIQSKPSNGRGRGKASAQAEPKGPRPLRIKADEADVIELKGKLEALSSLYDTEKKDLWGSVDQLGAILEHKAEKATLEPKIDRLEVFALLDAIVTMEHRELTTNGETFLTSNHLLGPENLGKPLSSHMCLSCERPLDALSRTLAEVVTHNSFGGRGQSHMASTGGSPMRTTLVARKALQEIEELRPESTDRISLARHAIRPDRYHDGKSRTQVLNLPKELYQMEVDKVKAAQKAAGKSPRGLSINLGNSKGGEEIGPFMQAKRRETTSNVGISPAAMDAADLDNLASSPRFDKDHPRGVKTAADPMTPRPFTGLPPVKGTAGMGQGLPIEVNVGPASMTPR